MSLKNWRFYFVIVFLSLMMTGLLARLVYLSVVDRSFLLQQNLARIVRNVPIPADRGIITDRNNTPLAISTPVNSVWADPQEFDATPAQLTQLGSLLGASPTDIRADIKKHQKLEFMYLARGVPPEVSDSIKTLKIPGVYMQQEYRRYYPAGEVDSHLLGFTDVDDQGQEGVELEYNSMLSGEAGMRRVIRDRLGHVISQIKMIRPAVQGHNLVLSIDQRIQYLAYRALKGAVEKFHAKSGSIVVLDPQTGEILAVVNQPSYNPNNRPPDTDGRYRNRAIVDMYEPGSVIKTFNLTLAIKSGKYTPHSIIDTSPGWLKIGGYKITDEGLDYGKITMTQVLQHSSNIGAAKIMLSLNPHEYWVLLHSMGFGEVTGTGFPGESPGRITDQHRWYPSVIATMAYGYGIAVSTLQLAHAYGVIANHGVSVPVTLLKRTEPVSGTRILSDKNAAAVTKMLESVIVSPGTGTRAAVPGYFVAGKTGTAYLMGPHGYDKDHYTSTFAGFAPATAPRLVIAVMLKDPQGKHFGALVAAPVFSKVMSSALRILNVPPDDLR